MKKYERRTKNMGRIKQEESEKIITLKTTEKHQRMQRTFFEKMDSELMNREIARILRNFPNTFSLLFQNEEKKDLGKGTKVYSYSGKTYSFIDTTEIYLPDFKKTYEIQLEIVFNFDREEISFIRNETVTEE